MLLVPDSRIKVPRSLLAEAAGSLKATKANRLDQFWHTLSAMQLREVSSFRLTPAARPFESLTMEALLPLPVRGVTRACMLALCAAVADLFLTITSLAVQGAPRLA